jgi:hypothetical protein
VSFLALLTWSVHPTPQAEGDAAGNLRGLLTSIGEELARNGISVENALASGWLGLLSGSDVELLADAHAAEERRLVTVGATSLQERLCLLMG